MKKISLKPDPFTNNPRYKIAIKANYVITNDLVLGNSLSNLAIGVIYTWAYDDNSANQFFREIVKEIGGYGAIVGILRTVYGVNLAITNVLKNPNINKFLLVVPNKPDNVHFVVNAIKSLYQNNLENSLSANKNINLNQKLIERFKEQVDLIIVKNFDIKDMSELNRLCNSIVSDTPTKISEFNLNLEFYSHKFNDEIVYDDGARFDCGIHQEPININPEIMLHYPIDIKSEFFKRAIELRENNKLKKVAWNLILHLDDKSFSFVERKFKENKEKLLNNWINNKSYEPLYDLKYDDNNHLFLVKNLLEFGIKTVEKEFFEYMHNVIIREVKNNKKIEFLTLIVLKLVLN